jgi:hypothetical protein
MDHILIRPNEGSLSGALAGGLPGRVNLGHWRKLNDHVTQGTPKAVQAPKCNPAALRASIYSAASWPEADTRAYPRPCPDCTNTRAFLNQGEH